MLVCSLPSMASAISMIRRISEAEALSMVKRQFSAADVDYYIIRNYSRDAWTFFVDAEPLKGWQHDCYLVQIPTMTTQNLLEIVPVKTKITYE